jgi:competence protein ComEC
MALMPWPMLLRLAALVCVAPLAAVVEGTPREGAAEVTMLDVGEGVSIVVRTARHVIVYGTGDSYGTDGRMAEGVLAPFLRDAGVGEVDLLIPGRTTAANAAGITALLALMPVRQTLVDCASLHSTWQWDGVTFELGPGASDTASADAGHACALSVSTSKARVRIPAAGAPAAAFVEADGHRWAVSSGRRSLRAAGKRAPAGSAKQGVEVLATGDLGAIRFQIDGERGVVGPRARRADKRTLWAASP